MICNQHIILNHVFFDTKVISNPLHKESGCPAEKSTFVIGKWIQPKNQPVKSISFPPFFGPGKLPVRREKRLTWHFLVT